KKSRFDGVSLASLLRGKKNSLSNRMFVVQYAGLEKLQEKYFSSVVWNSWRLVGADELYDLTRDPGQQKNVAAEHAEVFRRMKEFYETWWKGVAPRLQEFVPVVVGSEENPVVLSSDTWMGESVNTQWKVAAGGGAPKGEP